MSLAKGPSPTTVYEAKPNKTGGSVTAHIRDAASDSAYNGIWELCTPGSKLGSNQYERLRFNGKVTLVGGVLTDTQGRGSLTEASGLITLQAPSRQAWRRPTHS